MDSVETMKNERQLPLDKVIGELNILFETDKLDKDPAMSQFLPRAYEASSFDWRSFFDTEFCQRFNGVMIRGAENVGCVFFASFPTPEVLQQFIDRSEGGDVLFIHHPIDLECGNPGETLGRGFLPIAPETLQAIKDKGLTVYACHAPMDCTSEIGTNGAIVSALGATVDKEFLPYGNGNAGRIVTVPTTDFGTFQKEIMRIFDISKLDVAGKKIDSITKVAIVSGGGDDVEAMKEAESNGCDVYLTGEIHSYHSGEWGRENTEKVNAYAATSNMALVGISHSASEFLVMKLQMVPWVEQTLRLRSVAIPQSEWWR